MFRKGIILGVAAVALGIGAYMLVFKNSSAPVKTAGSEIMVRESPTPAPASNTAPPAPTPAFKAYSNSTFGFSLEYPSNWTVHQDKEFVGFKSDEWVKDAIQGDTITISTFKNVTKDKILQDSGFESDGKGGYRTTGSAAAPPQAAFSTKLNGMEAISSDTDARLYGGTSNTFIGIGDAKNIIVFGRNGIAANLWIIGHGPEFDHILKTFRLTP